MNPFNLLALFSVVVTVAFLYSLRYWLQRPLLKETSKKIGPRQTLKALHQQEQQVWEARKNGNHYDYHVTQHTLDAWRARLAQGLEGNPESSTRQSRLGLSLPIWSSLVCALLLAYLSYWFMAEKSGALDWQYQQAVLKTKVADALERPQSLRQRPQDKSLTALCQALQIELQSHWPRSVAENHALGLCALKHHQLPQAMSSLRLAVQQAPEDVEASLTLAQVLLQASQAKPDKEVQRLLSQILQSQAQNTEAAQLLGLYHYHNRQYAKAVETWQALLPKLPQGSKPARNLQAAITQAKRMASTR